MPVTAPIANTFTPSTASSCYHCGEPCPAEPVLQDDKAFCCEGCRTVYDILNNNGLCQYYQIDDKAGVSLRGKEKEEYAYLDDPDVRNRLIDFSDGEKTKVTFFLPQIHCASCIWLLENLYKLNEGVLQSQVNFLKKEVHVTFLEQQTSLRKIANLMATIGYAPAINLGSLEDSKRPVVDRSFAYKLGIAGFAFGNIMLLSFPEYLGLEKDADPMFFRLFGYLNILLSLPVVFYSGWDYFRSAWVGLKQRELTIDVPLALGIFVFFIRSVYEILSFSEAGYMDSLAGLVFFLLIGKWFQQRTYHHISFERDYRSYFPIAARRKENGKENAVALDKLQPGDIILVRHGELIPADAILLHGEGQIDYSFVTGEALPVRLPEGEKVFAGGRQMGGTLELSLTKKVSQSYLTQLWNEEVFAKKQEMKASRIANRIGRYFTSAILLIGVGSLVYWLPQDFGRAINAFTAVLIVACPCAVALAIPFIFGNVLRILGRNHFYLKNTNVIEAIRSVDTIVVDKTGTITTRNKGEVHFHGEPLTPSEKATLFAVTAQSAHPMSQLIRQYLEDQLDPSMTLPRATHWEEVVGKGVRAMIDDQEVLVGSRELVNTASEVATPDGIWISFGGSPRGYFTVGQYLRPGTGEVLKSFQEAGEVYLLSGDNDREIQLLSPLFQGQQRMHFRQSPKDKLQFVRELQESRKRVLMLGDGLNDAGALKQSDVGIVVTEDTSNFTPASDAILHADQYERLPDLLAYARRSVNLVFGAYGFALVYNIIGLSFAVRGELSPLVAAILMPLSSITIVLFGIISSNLLARRHGL